MSVRRLDWHVLLPGYRSAGTARWILFGGGHDLARIVVESGLAGSAVDSLVDSEPADVVALLHGTAERPERASRALAPGGILYWEVDRTSPARIALTPGRARRRLRAAHLTPLATYWVGPGWTHPSRFIPLDPRGPLAWYLTTIGGGADPVSAAIRAILRALAGIPGAADLVVPRFAVLAAAHPPPAGRGPAVLRDAAMAASARSSPVPPVLLTGGEEAWSRITVLAFGDGASAPRVAVKIARRAEDDEATRHEHTVLVAVRERVDADLRASVPEPLALTAVGRRTAIVQEMASGTSALARLRRWPHRPGRAARDLALTAAWLAALHNQTMRSREVPGSSGWRAHVEVPFERFLACFEPRSKVVRLIERTGEHAASIGASLPIVLEHGDLGPWNVLVDGNQIRVIDWEVARDGPAMTDLVYAALHWRFAALGAASEAERRRHLRRILGGNHQRDPDQIAFRDTLHDYGRAMAIDPRLTPLLVTRALVGQAIDRFDRLSGVGGAGAGHQATNRYVGYVEEIAGFSDAWLTGGALTRTSGGEAG